jgi:hypothetical protein
VEAKASAITITITITIKKIIRAKVFFLVVDGVLPFSMEIAPYCWAARQPPKPVANHDEEFGSGSHGPKFATSNSWRETQQKCPIVSRGVLLSFFYHARPTERPRRLDISVARGTGQTRDQKGQRQQNWKETWRDSSWMLFRG